MASINSHRAPSSFGTFLLGIACLAVFAAIVVAWTKSRAPKSDIVETERANARVKKREELEKEWAGKLQTVAWVNKEKGEVQLPIDDAIKVFATELKAKKVAKTEVKVPPAMQAPPVDPKSTEPPPLALPSAPHGADMIQFVDPFAPTPAPPAPGTPGPAPTAPAPAPGTPAPAAPPVPPPVNPAPAIPPKDAAPPAPDAPNSGVAAGAPARPPLINWTESK